MFETTTTAYNVARGVNMNQDEQNIKALARSVVRSTKQAVKIATGEVPSPERSTWLDELKKEAEEIKRDSGTL